MTIKAQIIATHLGEMRCLQCSHRWDDLEAACNQYPALCPRCAGVRTEPTHDCAGAAMPEGWTW